MAYEHDDPVTGRYLPAALCKRGHVIASDMTDTEIADRCPECGARVLTACHECGQRIRGLYHVPGEFIGQVYEPPKFCDKCGAPFPWAGRKERIHELQNLLDDDEDLDEATKLWVREQLDRVLHADPTDEREQRRLWQELDEHAGDFLRHPTTRRIVDTVISEAVKRVIRYTE
jgi:hypothetical protein